MKNKFNLLILIILVSLFSNSCTDLDDTLDVPSDLKVQNFIWKGLNLYYLWQADVPDLADNRFANQSQLNDFLRTKSTPSILFQDLLNKPISKFPRSEAIDRFSVLVNDYTYLENLFQGITKNNGVDFGLRYKSGTSGPIFGWVRYIIPNSDASTKDIQRGTIFYGINGTALTVDNYNSLLNNDTYTLNLADYDGGNITPNGKSITLTKTELTENPVFKNQILNVGNKKVAYLVYNAFTSNYNNQLNEAFGVIKNAAATHLVLDLRYNSGGSVQTATYLASLITGQFTNQLFAKKQWNNKVQSYYEENNPSSLVENFTDKIENGANLNTLNFNKVYILTTKSTASASELVINGLKPYINVVQIGDVTTGKNVGSITLYDSPTFGKEGRNASHKYAMQPLVLKTANKAGFGDYQDGLEPTFLLKENLGNLNELGNENEPLLSQALSIIAGGGRMSQPNFKEFSEFEDSKSMQPFGNDMYLDSFK